MKKLLFLSLIGLSASGWAQSLTNDNFLYAQKSNLTPQVLEVVKSENVKDIKKIEIIEVLNAGFIKLNNPDIPVSVRQMILDQEVFGLDPKTTETYSFTPNDSTITQVFKIEIKDRKKFDEMTSKNPLLKAKRMNDITELLPNILYIKGNTLFCIYSKHDGQKRYFDYEYFKEERQNIYGVKEISKSFYLTKEEYEKYCNTPLHKRQLEQIVNSGLASQTEILQYLKTKESLKFYYDPTPEGSEFSSFNEHLRRESEASDYTYYGYNSDATPCPYLNEKEEEFYKVQVVENLKYSKQNSEDSYYGKYKADTDPEEENSNDYESVDSTAIDGAFPAVDESPEYDSEYTTEVEAAVDSAAAATADYPYSDYEYDQYDGYSKKDRKKIMKLDAQRAKIVQKYQYNEELPTVVDPAPAYDEEETEEAYDDEEKDEKKYYEVHVYVKTEKFDNLGYLQVFLNSTNPLAAIDVKGKSDYINSKSVLTVLVNQEKLIKTGLNAMNGGFFGLKDSVPFFKEGTYFKNSSILFNIDVNASNNFEIKLKGFGNSEYMLDARDLFSQKIPASWLNQLPEKPSAIASFSMKNNRLNQMYDKIIDDYLGESTYAVAFKNYFNIVGIVVDEEEIFKNFNGNWLSYTEGTVSYDETKITYDYDEEYNYTEKEVTEKKTYPKFVSYIGYDKKDLAQSIVNIIQAFGYAKEKNGIYTFYDKKYNEKEASEKSNLHIYMTLSNDAAVISNDFEWIKKVKSGKIASTQNAELKKQILQNPILFMVDKNKFKDQFEKTDLKKMVNEREMEKMQKFDSLMITGVGENKDSIEIKMEADWNGGNENVLLELMKIMN